MRLKGLMSICCGIMILGSMSVSSYADDSNNKLYNNLYNITNEDIIDTNSSDWSWIWNATANVNLRASYSTSASIKTVINKGEKVYSLTKDGPIKNGFINVRVKRNGSWVYGWASANYFKWSSDNEIHPIGE
ncbi:MAG: hypothetical protein MSH12_10055 [Romboutsia timonensis]|nr:hypothetical protein [Romboutsia timonensis]